MILSREAIQRMTNSTGVGGIGRNGRAGGGGGEDDMSNYATLAAVENGYISKDFFNQMFETTVRVLVTDYTAQEVLSDTTRVLEPNEIVVASSSETDPDTQHVITTTMTITGIQAKAGLWTPSYLSALGQNTGGGGGGAVALTDLVDVAISNPTNGQVLMYNSTTNKWYNGTVQSGGGSVTSITAGTGLSGGTITSSGTIAISSTYQSYISHGETAYGWGNHSNAGYATQQWVTDKGYLTSVAFSDLTSHPTTLSGYGITDAKIASGTITLGLNTITPWTSSNHPTTLSGYGITDALSNATTFWGRTASNGVVSGNMTSVGSIEMSSLLYMANGQSVQFKDSGGTYRNVLTLNAGNQLAIGYHIRQQGYMTELQGGSIAFTVGTSGVSAMDISSVGRVWVKQGTQGLRIGDGLITWDSSHNALKISDAWGNSASVYALGAISALGFSSSGGTTSIDSLTINSSILVNDYAGSSLKALSVTKATSSTTVNYLNIGETWKAVYHDTRVYGYNVQLVSGDGAYTLSMNGAGKVTCPNSLQASRIYLDSTRYLYLSGSNLYFYNGSSSVQIA